MSCKIYRFLILASTLLFFACEKVDFANDYIITTYTESRDKGDLVPIEGAIMHTFYADTSLWEIKSYEDAVAGRLTGRKSNLGSTKMADVTLRSDANGVGVFKALNQEGVIMIVCDESSKRYAWRVSQVRRGLESVTVSLIFQLWKRESFYAQKRWVVVDDFLDDRSQIYEVTSYVEENNSVNPSPVAGISMHAFYADTIVWEVKSYADAVAGVITKRDGSGETMRANISVMSDTKGLGILDVAMKPTIIVVCDDDMRYGWLIIEEDSSWRKADVVFQLWRRDAKYSQDGWTMVDEIASQRAEIDTES